MSFDDGCGNEMSSESDFRAKFVAAMQECGLTFSQVCEAAQVSVADATHAIEQGTYGLPQSMPMLARLLSVMNLDITYLLGGSAIRVPSLTERRRELRTLTWDFILRNPQMPRQHRQPLIQGVLATLENRPVNSVSGKAARHPVPRTAMDIAYIYQRMFGVQR